MISIQTNIAALYGQENYQTNANNEQSTIEQLTSGYRINSSADDAAGLAIANSLTSETTELTQGVSNANNGVSQLQIIDGGLTNISSILDRLKTLATEAASSTFTGNFTTLNNEFQTDIGELNRQAANIGLTTGGQFNQQLGVYVGGGIGNQNGGQIGTAVENVNLANNSAFFVSAATSATQVTGTYAIEGFTQWGFAGSGTSYALAQISQSGFTATGVATAVAFTTVQLGSTSVVGTATLNFASGTSSVAVTATAGASVDAYSLGLAVGSALSAASNLNINGTAQAQQAITAIAAAVQNLGKVQAIVGAGINQLNFAVGLAQSQITNYTSDKSGIMDANIAQEASNLTKYQVLSQSSLAALAQANQQPQLLLKLLQ